MTTLYVHFKHKKNIITCNSGFFRQDLFVFYSIFVQNLVLFCDDDFTFVVVKTL